MSDKIIDTLTKRLAARDEMAGRYSGAQPEPNYSTVLNEVRGANADLSDALRESRRLLAIEQAAHALLDTIGPTMAGLEGAPVEVQRAAEALAIALTRGR